jgi:Ca-activated chloride channel family protein
MSHRPLSVFAVIVVVSLIITGCAPAAMSTPAPQQPPQYAPAPQATAPRTNSGGAPNAGAPNYVPPAAPVQPAPQQKATGQVPPADLQFNIPPASGQPCCPPTSVPPVNEFGRAPFMDTRADHLSTFAMDVDTASYTRARDYLRNGQLPPIDLIRVEEFVNYFKYEYPEPTSGAFAIDIEGARSPFSREGAYLVKVGIQAKHIADWQRKDAQLTFVIDVSGSMSEDNKMEMVKHGLTRLADQLGPNDRVAIVAFTDTAWVVIEPTSAENRGRIYDAINGLYPMNSTNTEAGLRLGYELAHRNYRDGVINRVILATDGVANVGNTDPNVLAQYAQDYYGRNIFLSTVGVGRGNYNDQLLETLSNKGNGVYAFLDSTQAAERIFTQDLTGALQTVAKDAKIQVDFNPNVVRAYRLLGYENRAVADQDFRNDAVDAGEVNAGQNVTALYEVMLKGETFSGEALTVRVRYEEPDTHAVSELSKTFNANELQSDFYRASPRFQLAAAVAQFAEILRGNEWARGSRMRDVADVAFNVQRAMPFDGDVSEFLGLVEQAARLVD